MNEVFIKALKQIQNSVGEIYWTGSLRFSDLETCLASVNLSSGLNSGWYKPKTIRIAGLKGFYMLNQDGSLYCESRIVKIDEKDFLIEHLTSDGWRKFESLVKEFQSENTKEQS